jgi:hypothetical protein
MIRVPYPIPASDRARLIAAGKEACAQPLNSLARGEAQEKVSKIAEEIHRRHGEEYPDG